MPQSEWARISDNFDANLAQYDRVKADPASTDEQIAAAWRCVENSLGALEQYAFDTDYQEET